MNVSFDDLSRISQLILCEAIALGEKQGKDYKLTLGQKLDIVLTFNGVEAPFEEAVDELYSQMEQQIDQQAAQLCLDKIKLTPIGKLLERPMKMIIRSMSWSSSWSRSMSMSRSWSSSWSWSWSSSSSWSWSDL